jgi:hypothetical protein
MGAVKLLDDGTVIGDPCHIIRNKEVYDEFLVTTQKIDLPLEEWVPVDFLGVSMQLYRTGVDGLFFGVPIDTGTVMKVREEDFLKLRKPTASAAAKAPFPRVQKTWED